jgi:Ca2+-binding EF-hand superfamily protein
METEREQEMRIVHVAEKLFDDDGEGYILARVLIDWMRVLFTLARSPLGTQARTEAVAAVVDEIVESIQRLHASRDQTEE